MKPTLFTNVQEIQALEHMFEIDNGEIDEAGESLLAEIKDHLENKTDNCVEFINVTEANIAEAKLNIERMQEFIESEKKKIEDFKKYVEFCMDSLKTDKFVGKFYAIKKTRPRKKVVVKDLLEVPIEMVRVIPEQYEVDKKAVAAAIKAGQDVPGVDYIEGKPGLKIGVKSKKD